MFENYEESSSFGKQTCPLPKGVTNVTNYTITTNFFPPFPKVLFPSGRINFKIIAQHHGKIPGSKKLVKLYSYIITGEVFDSKFY